MMFDLISIGDVTEDVFIQVDHAATLSCDARHNRVCHLEFPFGTKVGIKRVDKLLGGNAGNMAIGSSRLGLRSALYAEVGTDSQGELIYRSLKDNNVSTTYFFRNKKEKTNYSVVLYFNDDRTILVHHEKRHYRVPSLVPSRWVDLPSMAEGNQKIFPSLLRYLARTKAQLGFNPGTFQLSLGLSKLKPVLQRCTFLCVNKEEAQKLLATKSTDVRFLLRKLCETGPELIVITDGEKGTYCYDGKRYLYCPIYDVPCLERTGAG
ncbi:MAG: carbohydrate kinase family protein, partial [Nanoarchaeota archaeon]